MPMITLLVLSKTCTIKFGYLCYYDEATKTAFGVEEDSLPAIERLHFPGSISLFKILHSAFTSDFFYEIWAEWIQAPMIESVDLLALPYILFKVNIRCKSLLIVYNGSVEL